MMSSLLVATVRRYADPNDPDKVKGYKSDGWMSFEAGAMGSSNWDGGSMDKFNLYVSVIRKTDWQPVMPYIYANTTSTGNNTNSSSTGSGNQDPKFVDISSTKKQVCTAGYVDPGLKYTGVPYMFTLGPDGTTVVYDDFQALAGSDKEDYSPEGGRPCLSFTNPEPENAPGMDQAKGTLVDFYLLGACKFVIKDCSNSS
jgi:hypothetical protein